MQVQMIVHFVDTSDIWGNYTKAAFSCHEASWADLLIGFSLSFIQVQRKRQVGQQ